MTLLHMWGDELLALRKFCSDHQFEEKQHADLKTNRNGIATLSFSTKRLASERGISSLPPGLSARPIFGQDPLICWQSFCHSGDCLSPGCTGLICTLYHGGQQGTTGLRGGASGEGTTSWPFLHNPQQRGVGRGGAGGDSGHGLARSHRAGPPGVGMLTTGLLQKPVVVMVI